MDIEIFRLLITIKSLIISFFVEDYYNEKNSFFNFELKNQNQKGIKQIFLLPDFIGKGSFSFF